MKTYLLCFTFLLISNLAHAKSEPLFLGEQKPQHLFVNNRILASINGKPITVMDVTKKLDVLFFKQFPQFVEYPVARFQFYQMHWQDILEDFIDKELVLLDAEENKLPVSNGDIRQELEETFGPNIIANLDKAGVAFEDAWKMMKEELIIRRMMNYRVHAKAIRKITPQRLREAYENYSKDNILPDSWSYRVITIRSPQKEQGEDAAVFAYQALESGEATFENLPEKVSAITSFGADTKATVSELLKHNDKDLSPAYKESLAALQPKTYSQPVAQKSRSEKSTVFRIFYLENHSQSGPPPFQEVSDLLEQKLLNDEIETETKVYFARLKKHYHVHDDAFRELITNKSEPFKLL